MRVVAFMKASSPKANHSLRLDRGVSALDGESLAPSRSWSWTPRGTSTGRTAVSDNSLRSWRHGSRTAPRTSMPDQGRMERSPHFRCRGEWIGEGSAIVTVEGELDMHAAARLRDVLKELETCGIARHLVIDLSLCSFIDSTGLGLLVAVQRRADSRLDLVVTDPQILDLLEITALDRLFRIHADRTAAIESLRSRVGELCSYAGEPIHTGGFCA